MFMHDALPTAELASPPGPTDRPESRSAGLLSLVRRLIDYGRTLVETLQQRNTPDAPANVAWCFGTLNVALIITRITAGLRLAESLEGRVIRGAHLLDAPPRPTRDWPIPAKPTTDTPTQDTPTPDTAAAGEPAQGPGATSDGAGLPSAREIARRVRHKPIGVVIAEICRDLGIDGSHPLWREVLDAVTFNGGNRGDLVRNIVTHCFDAAEAGIEPDSPPYAMAIDQRLFGRTPPPVWATPPP